jgi:hypothetical protein
VLVSTERGDAPQGSAGAGQFLVRLEQRAATHPLAAVVKLAPAVGGALVVPRTFAFLEDNIMEAQKTGWPRATGAPRRMRACLLASIGAVLSANTAQASLVGDEITANLYEFENLISSITETVFEGPEVTGNWLGAIGYDIEASTITLWSIPPQPAAAWVHGLAFEFADLDWVGFPDGGEIVAVNVTSATGPGWSDVDNSNVSFTAHSVTIDASEIGGVTVAPDQLVSIEITFAPVCPEDVTGDGVINVLDLIDLLLCFGQPAVPGCEAEDVNGDGTVNVLDLIDVLLEFGQSCSP